MDYMTIKLYSDLVHRSQVVEFWEKVFGYETAHNQPSVAIDKKIVFLAGT